MAMCGGHSGRKEIDDSMREYFNGVRAQIEEKLGQAVGHFEPVAYTSQVVAGTIYWVVIRIADGADGHCHAKIF